MEVCHVIIDDSRQLLQMLPFASYILIETLVLRLLRTVTII